MLGSIQDSEDAVQETLLRAWKARTNFDGRASLRRWLYGIATNVCLTRLSRQRHTRRILPEFLGPIPKSLEAEESRREAIWLEPYPDSLLDTFADPSPGPYARYESRETIQLAFVAAIQLLPARQRAVLLLRDVVGMSAVEAAEALDCSVAGITSALQRARASLRKQLQDVREPELRAVPSGDQERLLLERYLVAWESRDMNGFIDLLKSDARFTMPPLPLVYEGPEAIQNLMSWAWRETGIAAFHLVPCGANGQPAFGLFCRASGETNWKPHAIQVLTLDGDRIRQITHFLNPDIFPAFGFPSAQECS